MFITLLFIITKMIRPITSKMKKRNKWLKNTIYRYICEGTLL